MDTDAPIIGIEDARDICAQPWPTEQEARKQAAMLDAAGWRVQHRHPPQPFGQTGRLIVANVYHPVTFESPGDVSYQATGDPGE
jgi:hypothetical protein